MRVRTQLALAFCLLAGFTAALIFAIYFLGAREILFRQIQSKVLSIAATAATQIDAEALEQITTPEQEDTDDYRRVQEQLRKIRDANRRDDVMVQFLYTMRPLPDGSWIYVVDAEEPGPDHSPVGERVEFEHGDSLRIDAPYAESSFSTDEFGTWLSANAPILDDAGNAVGLLGVDLNAGIVVGRMRLLLIAGLIASGIAIVTAALLSFWIARWFTKPVEKISHVVRQIGEGDLTAQVKLDRRDEFGELAKAVNEMAVTLRERDALKRALARYVSREVAEEVLAGGEPVLAGTRKEVTVLIVDIRNFTAMSAQVEPEMLVAFLNEFFARMIDAIFANRGTLDKFLGDGCLAIFGAPIDDPDHRGLAVLAAQSMLRSTHELAIAFKEKTGIDLRIGIAVHTGEAIVGNVGSEHRIEYTAIGDTVNVTSRVENLNKEYHTELLVTDSVVSGLNGRFPFREVAETTLRGVAKPVKVFTLA